MWKMYEKKRVLCNERKKIVKRNKIVSHFNAAQAFFLFCWFAFGRDSREQ